MSFATGLICRECGTTYPGEARYVCDFCFGPLEVGLRPRRRPEGWLPEHPSKRGRPPSGATARCCPTRASRPVDLGAGWTPLRRARGWPRYSGVRELWLKDDTRNPTGSFKDRVVSVALSSARRLGFTTAACASTGNLATSVAAHAAVDRLAERDHHPGGPREVQDRHGGDLRRHRARRRGQLRRREPALRRTGRRAPRLGLRQHQRASLLRRGLEDTGLRDRRATRLAHARPGGRAASPRAASSPRSPRASSSSSTSASSRATRPCSLALRPLGCSPIATAFAAGADVVTPQRPNTIARSLAIGNPADGPYVLDELRASGGDCGSVLDEEILECIELLARTEGRLRRDGGRRHHRLAAPADRHAARSTPRSRSWRSSRATA